MAVVAGQPTAQPEPENPLTAGLERLPVAPTTLVIFGATGDLARRKLLPALYNLAHEGALPERFHLVGVSRAEKAHEDYRAECEQSIRQFSRRTPKEDVLAGLLEHVKYVPGVFDDDSVYTEPSSNTPGTYLTCSSRLLSTSSAGVRRENWRIASSHSAR